MTTAALTTATVALVTPMVNVLLFNGSDQPNYSIISNGGNGSGDDTNKTTVQEEEFLLDKVTYYMASYYIWVMFVAGLPGNIASIFTILTMPTVSSSKAHVAILAITDSLALISKVTYHEISNYGVQIFAGGCKFLMFFSQFTTVFPNWIVVAMTTERCLAVCFPLRVGRMYSRRRALAVLTVFAFLVAAVYFGMLIDLTEVSSSHGHYCYLEWNFLHQETFFWVDACATGFFPCSLVLAGNTLIVLGVQRSRRTQRHLTNTAAVEQRGGGRTSREHRQITIMLILVSAVFLILNLPNAIFYAIKTTWKESLRKSMSQYGWTKYRFFAKFVDALINTNHAVNFYLYFLSMSTFRRRFLDSLRCRRGSGRGGNSSSVYRTSHTYMNCPQANTESCRTDGVTGSPYARHFNGQGNGGVGHGKGSLFTGSTHSLKSFNNQHNVRVNVGGSGNPVGDKSTSQV